MKYDFASIEKKWQQKWLEEKPFTAVTGDKTREKFFGLIEFPYPSGQGLHVGHARPFTAMDIICRKKRMQGCLPAKHGAGQHSGLLRFGDAIFSIVILRKSAIFSGVRR